MLMVEKVSIFSKFHYNKNVLRATSEQKLVTLFLIKNVYRNESKNVLAYIYLLVLFPSYFVTGAFKLHW